MKPLRKHLKLIALFLAVTFLVQSCKVYKYPQATLEEAVKSNDKVKVNSNTNEKYIFTQLEKNNGQYYGITKSNSTTAKLLSDQITYQDEFNYVKILLNDEQLRDVYVKKHDKALSTIVSILVPVIIIYGILLAMSSGGSGYSFKPFPSPQSQ